MSAGAMLGKLGMAAGGGAPAAGGAPPSSPDLLSGEDGDGSDEAPDEAQAAAGEEFAAALKSGDGAEIVRAFKGLQAACKEF